MALNFPDNPIVGYIYNDPTSSFSYEWDGVVWKSYAAPSSSNIKLIDDISGSFNNSNTSFPITVNGQSIVNATTKQLLISVGGVIQNPTVDFNVVGSNVIFTTAPNSGLTFFGTLLGGAQSEQVSVYNKQSYTPVGVQTNFTFSTGYAIGYLDVFRNGVRLISGSDFTASDGSTFVLSPPARNGDDIEAVGFNVDTVTSIDGNITNLNVSNNANITGIVTATSFVGNVTGSATYASTAGVSTYSSISGIATYASISGVSTYSSTAGIATYASTAGVSTVSQGLTGTPNINVGIATVNTTLRLTGNYVEDADAVAALNIDCSTGNYFTKTVNGVSSFTVSNVPSGAYSFTLEVTHTSGTITWFSGVEWPGGTSPTLTTSKTHLFMFSTVNGGSRWRASSLINYTT